jgi:hypothetical protein
LYIFTQKDRSLVHSVGIVQLVAVEVVKGQVWVVEELVFAVEKRLPASVWPVPESHVLLENQFQT